MKNKVSYLFFLIIVVFNCNLMHCETEIEDKVRQDQPIKAASLIVEKTADLALTGVISADSDWNKMGNQKELFLIAGRGFDL